MKTKHQRIYRTLVFLSYLLAAPWVQAAMFSLNFFDQNNTKVGQGQFAIDFNSKVCVEVIFGLGNCQNNPSVPDAFGKTQYDYGWVVDKKNPLTGFEANLQGVNWGFEVGGQAWWAAEGQPAGYLYSYRVPDLREGVWELFADRFSPQKYLGLFIENATSTSGSGTWVQFADDIPGGSSGEGTWTATATPIPAAVWLFASGLGALGVFRRKMSVKS